MRETTETSWASTREKFTGIFGAPPDWQADNDIAATFRAHPFEVIRELEQISQAFGKGRLHSPWRAMAKKLDKIHGDHAHVDVNGNLRIRQAEAWIRNAGIHCPELDEVRHELFHATSALLAGLEAELGERMADLWRTERPRAWDAEQDFLERAERRANR